MNIELKVLHEDFIGYDCMPEYKSLGACGLDLVSTQDFTIKPGETYWLPLGFALNLRPKALWERQAIRIAAAIIPRSSTGSKGLHVANSTGFIDEDYQGEIILVLRNVKRWHLWHKNDIKVKAGDRVAQMYIFPVYTPEIKVVKSFSTFTGRGVNGFGSTGK